MTDRTPDLLAALLDDESLSEEEAAAAFRAALASRKSNRAAQQLERLAPETVQLVNAPAPTPSPQPRRGLRENEDMRGALFENDKQGNPKRPDFTGHLQVAGKRYRMAAWDRRATGSGQRYLSVSLDELTR